jgi:hypothetical protein
MFDEVQDFYQKAYYWNPEKAEGSKASEKQVKYLEKLSFSLFFSPFMFNQV